MSNDEEIREDEEEEVIEVVTSEEVTESDEEEEFEEEVETKGVDIIGDRPPRRVVAPSAPGCLYSFLLALVGFAVGWVAQWTLEVNQPTYEDEYLVRVQRALDTRKALLKLAAEDMLVAYEQAKKANYGLACEQLKRVRAIYRAAEIADPETPLPTAKTVREVIPLLESKVEADRALGMQKLEECIRVAIGGAVPEEVEEILAVQPEEATESAPESAALEEEAPEVTEEAAETAEPATEAAAEPTEESAEPAEEAAEPAEEPAEPTEGAAPAPDETE